MDAATLFRQLHEAGVTVNAEDDRLLVGPADRLTDELRRLIRTHKPELLQFMADAHATAGELIEWAMRTCDRHRDAPAAREEMHRQCMATPPHLRADLLDHFRQTNRGPI